MAQTSVEVKKAAPAPAADNWRSFRDEMDRLVDRFAGGFAMPAFRRLFDTAPASFNVPMPAVDVTEDNNAFKITAELPGLEEKDVSVTVVGSTLTIKGEKSFEKEEKVNGRHVSERSYGSFQRSFALPEGVAGDKITADLSKGVLTVMLPKTAAAQQARKVEIKATA